jgi:MFS transporter, DHA3 family, tetracycline resistance protein
VAGGVVTVGLGVLLAAAMPETAFRPPGTSWRSLPDQLIAGVRTVRRSAPLAALVGGTFFAGMSSEGFDRLS